MTSPTLTSERPTARSRRGWRAAGIVTTVVVIGGGITAGPALAWGYMQNLDTTTEQSARTYRQAPKTVSVEATTANVTLAPAVPGQVSVERTVEWARTKPTIDEAWSRGAFDVDMSCSEGLSGWVNDVCRIDYLAKIPARTPVQVSLTTGDITVDGAVGDVQATATTGDVTGDQLTAPVTTAHATTGSIDLDYDAAPDRVEAEVTTGDISISVPDDGGAYRILGETQTGKRDIEVPTDPAAERVLDVTSTTGDVEIGYRK